MLTYRYIYLYTGESTYFKLTMTQLRMPYRLFWLIKDKCDEESSVRKRGGPSNSLAHCQTATMCPMKIWGKSRIAKRFG